MWSKESLCSHAEESGWVRGSRTAWSTTEALDNRKREEIVNYAALVTPVELLTGGELMHGCARRLEQGGWGLKMEIEEQVRFFKQLDSLADLRGISDPSVCRVPRPDEPVCRVPRQGWL